VDLVWDLCVIINIVKVYFPVQDFGHLKSYFPTQFLNYALNAKKMNISFLKRGKERKPIKN
jgi:hypothetical protein